MKKQVSKYGNSEWLAGKIQSAKDEKAKVKKSDRRKLCQSRVERAAKGDSLDCAVDCVIWSIHLVSEVPKTKRLSAEVDKAIDFALNAINIASIRFDFLAIHSLERSLHLAISKMRRMHGKHWASAWYFECAFEKHLLRTRDDKLEYLIGEASRYMRLGFGNVALTRYEQAIEFAGSDRLKALRTAYAKALRLTGRSKDFVVHASSLRKDPGLSLEEKVELDWEFGCHAMTQNGRCSEILNSVLFDMPHYDADYYCEAILWAYGFGDKVWIRRLPKVRYVVTKSEFKLRQLKEQYDVIRILEECGDEGIPVPLRLSNLQRQLDRRGALPSIDREQLFLAASIRWLCSKELFGLAGLCHLQYRQNSLSLSGGLTSDHLNLLGDVKDTSTYID